jgi:hypothetical protein
MYINPYLEDRLASQRINEALCVAKLDCLLRAARHSSKNRPRHFPIDLFLVPLMLILAPIHLGIDFLRRQ